VAKPDWVDLDYVASEILYELADIYKALALMISCDSLLDKAKTLEAIAAKREVDCI
jgi:hypothetical protein